MGRRKPEDGDLAFVPEWADRVCRFFEEILVHTKGRYARSPFLLAEWQRDEILRPLFGTARWDAQFEEWVRLYTEAWIELGSGNGKSELMAGIGLYLLTGDGEHGAEIFGGAKDRDQASAVFGVAAEMVKLSPILRRECRVIESRKRIVHPATASVYQVIAADAAGNLAWNPHGVLFDEIISQPNGDLYHVLRKGLAKRHQPLMVCATTAGADRDSFAFREHEHALRIAEDPAIAPQRFVYIRNAPDEAELDDLDALRHANPALGDFLSETRIDQERREVEADPTKEPAYRQFRMNQWGENTTSPISSSVWRRGAGRFDFDELVGAPAYGGLDLAATTDLAAWSLFFPSEIATALDEPDPDADPIEALEALKAAAGELHPDDRHRFLWRFWCPEAMVRKLSAATGGQFEIWVSAGLVTVTEGDVIDYRQIHRDIAEDAEAFGIQDIGIDPWNSTATITWAQDVGLEIATVRQTFAALSPPTKELLRMLRAGLIAHGDNPVAAWNFAGLDIKRDNSDNMRPIRPDRLKSTKRIDGAVASIMAVDGWMRRGRGRGSAYDEHGLEVV